MDGCSGKGLSGMKIRNHRGIGKRIAAALLCATLFIGAGPALYEEPVYAAEPMLAAGQSKEITTFVTSNNKKDAVSLSIKDGALHADSLPSGDWQRVSLGIRKGEAKVESKTFPISAPEAYPLPTEDCTCYVYLALGGENTYQTILNGTKIGITVKNGRASFVYSSVYDNNRKLFDKRSKSAVILGYYKHPNDVSDIDAKEIKELAKKIVSAGDSDYEKIKKVHDWVADNIWYDYNAYLGEQAEGECSYVAPVKVLETKRTVCLGYANLTAALLCSLGIPTRVVSGYTTHSTWDNLESLGSHAWNEAYADGRWVILDTTWDSHNRYYQGEFSEQKPSTRMYFDPTLEYFSIDHRLEQTDNEFQKSMQEYVFKNNTFSVSSTFMILTKGETRQLKVKKAKGFEYIKMKKVKITYSSSNKKVATVDSKGKIKAKKRGQTFITTKIKFDSFTIKYQTEVNVWGA